MDNYEDCIIFLLAKAYQAAHGRFKRKLADYGLTPVQHLILEALWCNGEGQAAGDIGKSLLLDSATLSGVLDRMSDSGWIEKKQDQRDKRVWRIFLTERSKSLRERLVRERRRVNEEILEPFDPEARDSLKSMLRELQTHCLPER
jgi:DNA-binding MarR family transcriptional regulator